MLGFAKSPPNIAAGSTMLPVLRGKVLLAEHGASGDFGAVLPHVSLARGTLPWERHATVEREATGDALTREHAEVKDAPSWLALIVLDADEAAGIVSTVKAGDLLGDPGAAPGQWTCDTKSDAPPRFDLRDKLLYGSDWHLVARIRDQDQLVCRFAEVLDGSDALRPATSRFFGDNARTIFNLGE